MRAFYEHMAGMIAVTPGLPTLSWRDVELIDAMLHQARDTWRGAEQPKCWEGDGASYLHLEAVPEDVRGSQDPDLADDLYSAPTDAPHAEAVRAQLHPETHPDEWR